MASRRIGKSRADVRVAATVRAPLSAAGVQRLADAVLRAEHATLAALSITFVGAARMRTLNRVHLGHDRPTDVIAFDLQGAGDVYICPAVAARNATAHGTTAKAETRRLVIHGVLHVLGYDHAAGEARTRGAMWRRQERYLARLGRLAP